MAGLYFDTADLMLIYGQGYGHLEADTDEGEVLPPPDQRTVRIWFGIPDAEGSQELGKLTTRGFRQTKETIQQSFPDCDEPSKLGSARTYVISKGASIEAEGLLSPDQREALQVLFDNDISSTFSFQIGTKAPYGGYYTGLFILTTFDILGEEESDSQRVQCALELQADGPYTWTAVE